MQVKSFNAMDVEQVWSLHELESKLWEEKPHGKKLPHKIS